MIWRPHRPILCLVTDRRRLADGSDDGQGRLLDLITAAVAAGVDLIHVRERDLSDRVLVEVVRQAVSVTRGTASRVVVNDRLDIARAAGAAGVHLRADSVGVKDARRFGIADWLVGRSVHAVDEAVRVAASGAVDYLVLGAVFATRSKPGHQPIGLECVREAVRAVTVPVLAIGGVTLDRVADLARAGVAGFAGIDLFVEQAGADTKAMTRLVTHVREEFNRAVC